MTVRADFVRKLNADERLTHGSRTILLAVFDEIEMDGRWKRAAPSEDDRVKAQQQFLDNFDEIMRRLHRRFESRFPHHSAPGFPSEVVQIDAISLIRVLATTGFLDSVCELLLGCED